MRRGPLRIVSLLAISAALAAGPAAAQSADLPEDDWVASLPRTGDVLVRLATDDDALLARIVARDDVLSAEHRAGAWPLYTLALPAGVDPNTLAATLDRLPGVSWAWADRVVPTELHALPIDDTYADNLWHLENVGQVAGGLPGADIEVVPAWAITHGEGQLIAVIDGGVEHPHPDLRVADTGWDAIDFDTDANPDPAGDNPGHGTLVAGIAAAIGDNAEGVAGVAYEATVWPVRAIGGGISQSSMYDAFALAVDAGAHVINNSWGYNTPEPCQPISPLPSMDEAMEYARTVGRGGLGTVVVFSAGNMGCEQNNNSMLNDNPGIIAVASVTDQDRKWGYSVWGAHVDMGAPSGGTGGGGGRPGLWSTDMWGDPGFNGAGENKEYSDRMGGTSGAAPVVSGTVGLMLAANPRLTEEEVRIALCVTADKIDPTGIAYDDVGWSKEVGCGRVNAAAAVSLVANAAPPAPVITFPAAGDELVLGQAVTWDEAVDPDGEALTYDLQLRAVLGDDDSAEDDEAFVAWRAGLVGGSWVPHGLDFFAGDWEVRAASRDGWGRGEWSEWVPFTLAVPIAPPDETPEEGSGCGGGGSALLVLLLPMGLTRRR